jgi:flagellar FliL protein
MSDTVNASLDDDQGDQDEGGGGLNAKKLLLFVVLPLLLIGGGVGAYFMGVFDSAPESGEHAEEGTDDGHGSEDGEMPTAAFVKIPDMIVNLSSTDGQPRYLRLSVQLELKNELDSAAVEQVMPRVIDQFQTYLRELRIKDLRGSAGIYRLQMELLSRVNAAAYPVEVQDVLFQEILIQ